jgi:hypothetical protein
VGVGCRQTLSGRADSAVTAEQCDTVSHQVLAAAVSTTSANASPSIYQIVWISITCHMSDFSLRHVTRRVWSPYIHGTGTCTQLGVDTQSHSERARLAATSIGYC